MLYTLDLTEQEIDEMLACAGRDAETLPESLADLFPPERWLYLSNLGTMTAVLDEDGAELVL